MTARTLIFAALVALPACAAAPKVTPRSVLTDYLEAERLGRYEHAWSLLTDADQEARSQEVYLREHLSAGPIWLAAARRTEFVVGKATDATDHTRFAVTARHPDLKALEAAVPGIPTDVLTTSPDPAARMMAAVEQALDTVPIPTVAESLVYAVRDQDGTPRVWLALHEQDAVIEAVARARKAAASGDTAATTAAWEAVLALPQDPAGVVASFHDEARRALGR